MDATEFKRKSTTMKRKLADCFKEVQTINEKGREALKDKDQHKAFKGMFKALEKYFSRFENLFDELTELYDNDAPVQATPKPVFPQEQDSVMLAKAKRYYYEAQANHETILSEIIPTPSRQSLNLNETHMSQDARSNRNLPRINLPHFNGQITNWPKFRDAFTSIIHNDALLSKMEKFHYLVSSLVGTASAVISTLPLIEDNYDIAWKALNETFDNKRMLASNYLNQLMGFKPQQGKTTVESLQSFLSQVSDNIAAFKLLKIPDEGDFILFHIAIRLLDQTTREHFELQNKGKEFPVFNDLTKFLRERCLAMQLALPTISSSQFGENKSSIFKHSGVTKSSSHRNIKTSLLSNSMQKYTGDVCCVCQNGSHPLFKCNKFTAASVDDRQKMLKSWRGCRNCLSYNHQTNKCNSKWCCKVCKKRHNSLLHLPVPANNAYPTTPEDESTREALMARSLGPSLAATFPEQTQVLLGTVLAEIQDIHGKFMRIRLVVDSGSQHSFITKKCANKLGLMIKSFPHKICAIGQTVFDGTRGKVQCCLKPCNLQSPIVQTEAVVVNNITSHLPNFTLPSSIWTEYAKFDLADPTFWQPGPVDFLLGSDLFSDIWNGSFVTVQEDQPKLFSSIFGYIAIGRISGACLMSLGSCSTLFTVGEETPDLGKQIQRFWELEEPPADTKTCNPEDEACEQHFQETHFRTQDGQYGVCLPFKTTNPQLGNPEETSLRRFYSLERRLMKNSQLKTEYHRFIQEYQDLGHMKATDSTSKYVIPHHSVVKEDRSQLKLRVVFDASARSPPFQSLNSQLMVGPKLQQDIRDILLRFRLHSIVFVADIVKMYRQILIHPKDKPYQHILWRFNPADQIVKYELCTVTYGLTSAPFLALRVMKQLAIDEGKDFPMAAQAISQDMYVDDIVTGASSITEALQLQHETIRMLDKGHFALSKWASNCKELLKAVNFDNQTDSVNFSSTEDSSVKILGLHWDPSNDVFMYKVQSFSPASTKRGILSAVARIYDPLGLLSPITFVAKGLIQDLWKLGLDWDQEIPSHLKSVWQSFVNQLNSLSSIHIPRHVVPDQPLFYHLVGFSDASALGYCATIYLRVINEDLITSNLIIAKTKLAPIKTVSIPRLELCGAHLLARLYHSVFKMFSQYTTLKFEEPALFTDASIVLGWLHTPPYKLKVFISNRVSHITDLTSLSCWRHVSSKDNPSDLGSRGSTADKLKESQLWWHGPPWLREHNENWPKSAVDFDLQSLPELKPEHIIFMTTESEPFIITFISSQSSYNKVLNIIAWIRRFISNIKAKSDKLEPCLGPLQLSETKTALVYVLKKLQSHYLFQDIDSASTKDSAANSKFSKLSPFFDDNGILRVGGRLTKSSVPFSQKHPILLPKCHFTTLLVDHYHKVYLHPGPGLLQALVQLRFWIPALRSLVRHRTFKCLVCYKDKAKNFTPKMADLPPSRVSSNRAFLHVGIDFAGPFQMRESLRRKAAIGKAYLCVFVCMGTKAIHLEIVTALSTDAFLAAFNRFIARRGLPEQCYSDCGTNFQGAANKLREFGAWYQQQSTQNSILQQASKLEIKWNFNPPSAPHFGGLWEAAVKSAKAIFRKVANDTPLTYEELTTWFVKIEAVLNSRPLCPLSSSPEETEYLSPGHFLIGSTLSTVPDSSLLDVKESALSRWQLLQRMTQHFWQRWRIEYLSVLQKRNKWTKDQENPKVGDLVLLKDPNVPVLQWPMGRITQVHPGEDGVVRVITVKVGNSEFRRPAVKLVPLLPLNSSHFE